MSDLLKDASSIETQDPTPFVGIEPIPSFHVDPVDVNFRIGNNTSGDSENDK